MLIVAGANLILFAMLSSAAAMWNGSQQAEYGSLTAMPTPAKIDSTEIHSTIKQQTRTAYGTLPMSFEANYGQSNSQVKFLARGQGYTLFLTSTEAVFVFTKTVSVSRDRLETSIMEMQAGSLDTDSIACIVLRMQLVNTDPSTRVIGLRELPGKSHYFIGNEPKNWRSNIPHYKKVRYEEVYSGIDLIFSSKQGQLKYDFIIHPGADPMDIKFAFKGSKELSIDDEGNLSLCTPVGEIIQYAPLVYQKIKGIRREIPGRYVLQDENEVGFEVNSYDSSHVLVIDPILVYSTYLGGSDHDHGDAIAVDVSGNAYVAGRTSSIDFPIENPLRSNLIGPIDIFIAKLNTLGSGLVYSAYIGGSDEDWVHGIDLDSLGYAYVTGRTKSGDFPTENPFQSSLSGSQDAFVLKLNITGDALIYSTYLGGNDSECGWGIVVDRWGNAFVAGVTWSDDFPIENPFQSELLGPTDAFVTKFNITGSTLIYSTYLGGSHGDWATGIALNESGNAYVIGFTHSSNFPQENSLQDYGGEDDAFVTKFDLPGSALVYSTYLGGSDFDVGKAIAVDASSNAFVAGRTTSTDFPTEHPVQSYMGGSDAFVTKLNQTGSAIDYSTYLGGSELEDVGGIAVDNLSCAYVTGNTRSSDFPTENPLQSYLSGINNDAFVSKLNAAGSSLIYSTYFGGSGSDGSRGIAVDEVACAYVTGSTQSTDFPLKNPFQSELLGYTDAFVLKLCTAQDTTTIDSVFFEYAAKFVCGSQNNSQDMRLARGLYTTAINIHNPDDSAGVKFRKKIALTYPPGEQMPGWVSHWIEDELGPNEALEVDCVDIQNKFFPGGFPTPYIKGFVIIQSPISLDVTAVYTTAKPGGFLSSPKVTSIDIEQIRERRKERRPNLPDLVPVPDPTGNFCIIDVGPAPELIVTVKNQGSGIAGTSTTEVDFFEFGSFTMITLSLDPGATTELLFPIPPGCFDLDCEFKITVDVMDVVTETNEVNNVADGVCF